jgi:hypothetical protein
VSTGPVVVRPQTLSSTGNDTVDFGQEECDAAILDGTQAKRIDLEEDNRASAKEKKNPRTLSSERWHPIAQSRPVI